MDVYIEANLENPLCMVVCLAHVSSTYQVGRTSYIDALAHKEGMYRFYSMDAHCYDDSYPLDDVVLLAPEDPDNKGDEESVHAQVEINLNRVSQNVWGGSHTF